jgi:hypothetical protein
MNRTLKGGDGLTVGYIGTEYSTDEEESLPLLQCSFHLPCMQSRSVESGLADRSLLVKRPVACSFSLFSKYQLKKKITFDFIIYQNKNM